MRKRIWVAAFVLLAACIPPEESNDRLVRYSTDTLMGLIQKRGELRVGVSPNFEPLAFLDDDGEVRGFLVDLSKEVADSLGVGLSFVVTEPLALFDLVDYGTVDLAFPPVALTEERARLHSFTTPYYVAHQRLLVRRGSPIDEVSDLTVGRVCSLATPETGVEPTAAQVVEAGRARCFRQLRRAAVDAVTGADIFLISAALHEAFDIVGEDLMTEGFAPAVPLRSSGFGDYVSAVLVEFKEEGRWMEQYERWLAPAFAPQDRLTEPPEMTMGEAAALYPADV